jgi:DNA-binding MarR family transcriptional regulator/GNAT superfamily N-acetyltransferase
MEDIARVRSFNRTVTHHLGALGGGFLGRKRSLGACRVLFEVGTAGIDIRQLRARLGLDSGYTSRLIRGLEAEQLVRTVPSPEDSRVRRLTLTAAGRRELALLNRLSDRAAESLLSAIPDPQRETLLAAMQTVERSLRRAAVRLAVVDPESRAAQYCLGQYFGELAARFEGGFEAGRSIPAPAGELTPPRGYFVLATLNGDPVGCGGMKCHEGWGEIKRMWVAPAARGLGVGRQILNRLEELARKRRLTVLRLETNRSLTEAQALYRSHGFREVAAFNSEPYAHHWFEKKLKPVQR